MLNLILVETSGAISLVDVNEMFYLQSINSKCTDEERRFYEIRFS